MPTVPTNEELNKAREQANEALGGAVEQARTPLLAALGAGDLAAQTVLETLNKVRAQVNERAEAARSGVNDLPSDVNELRERLDPAELRKRIDGYTQSAVQLYGYLADRGEDALGRLRTQPQVQRAWSQVETAQDNVGGAVGDVRDMADDVLGKVTRSTRSFGEQAAEATAEKAEQAAETVQETADETAESVRETGAKAASETRSTARKAANSAESTKSSGSAKATAAGSGKSSGSKTSSGKTSSPKTSSGKTSSGKQTAAEPNDS